MIIFRVIRMDCSLVAFPERIHANKSRGIATTCGVDEIVAVNTITNCLADTLRIDGCPEKNR